MAARSAILSVRILGDSQGAQKAMGAAGDAGGRLSGAMGTLGTAAAAGFAAVAAAAVVGTKALYEVGETFDEVSDSIIIGTGASGEALEGLTDAAKNVGTTVPVEFSAAGDAVASLNTYLGATGKPLEDMSAAVLDASRMLGEDGVSNADAFGRSMQQWQRPAEDGAEVLDSLFAGTQKYGLGLDDTIGHLNTYGAALQNAGFTMEESAALFGQLESGGLSVSRIMPGLNKSFRDWASEGKNLQDELGGTVESIKNAEDSTAALSIATDVFGAEGAQRMTTAIRNGTLELGDLSSALDGTAGTIADTAAETASFGENWTLFKNTALAAIEPVGTAIFDGLGGAMGSLTEWLQGLDTGPIEDFAEMIGPAIEGAAEAFGGLLSSGTPLTAFFEALSPHLETLGQMFSDLAPVLADFAEGVMPLIGDAFASILPTLIELASDVLPLILDAFSQMAPVVLELAEAALPVVLEVIETLLPVIADLAETVLPPLMELLPVIGEAFLALVEAVAPLIPLLAESLVPVIEAIAPLLVTVVEVITSLLGPALEVIVGVVNVVVGVLTGDWAQAWEGAKQIVSGAIDFVKAVITGGIDLVKQVIVTGLDLIVNNFTGAWDNVKSGATDAATNLGDAIGNGIDTVISFVTELPGKVLSALGDLGSLLLDSGAALMDGFTQGIRNGIGAAMDAASGAVDAVRDFFPFSPAKRGPFSGSGYTDNSGKALVADFAKAMTSELSTVDRAANKVASAGTFEGGFDLNNRPAQHAGAQRDSRPPVKVEVNFNSVVTDRLGVAREIKRILSDYDRLVVGT
ncbi:phage tail tape measure protein [Microbacterium sp.]|uniref:phage tail tape measure protein n=1 Tax=Microbacterium sp. TaxID=51671 RepID=UPI003F95A3E0